MSAELPVESLLRVAQEDLAGARALAAIGNRNAIYLAEQAAEKVIRAVLTAERKHAGISHRLSDMVDMVSAESPLLPALRAIQDLSAYATAYRYPSPAGRIPPSPDPARFEDFAQKVAFALTAAADQFGADLARSSPTRRS